LTDFSSQLEGPSSQQSTPPSDLEVPIALRKGKKFCTVNPISQFVSYDRHNPSFCQFALSLSSIFIRGSYEEAILVHAWKHAMNEEMDALISRETRELISAPTYVIVGCR